MRLLNSKTKVLLVYGEGGHEAQMNRLATGLSVVSPQDFIALTDSYKHYDWCDNYFLVNEVRDKHRRQWFAPIFNISRIINQLFTIRRQFKVVTVISSGPGVSFVAALFFKLFGGARVIHVETWSRFYSRSLTGRMMYWIADIFYIQNRELASLYPKAIYSGRL